MQPVCSHLVVAAGLLAALSCGKQSPPGSSGSAPSASVARRPLDRLAAGELAPGDGELFGLPVPRGMVVQGKFRDSALASGKVSAEDVASYVRDYVLVDRVEIASDRTIFAAARIKNGPPGRTFYIEVVGDGPYTRLLLRDVTPAPAPEFQGLSSEELWNRAGFTRDGQPLNPKALE